MDARIYKLQEVAKPLDGNLYLVPGVADMLGMEFLESLYGMLRYDTDRDDSLPIHRAAGRNYTVPLPRQFGAYNGLQVAGGGNYDLGIRSNDDVGNAVLLIFNDSPEHIIEPPSEHSGLFTGYTTYYEGGDMVEKANINPVGSYSAQSAKRKIDNTTQAHRALRESDPGVWTPLYVGRFEYDVADQNGDPQTAMLFLVPQLGERFDELLLRPLRYAVLNGDETDPNFDRNFRERYLEVLAPCFRGFGLGLAATHLSNLNHNQPTAGNVAVFKLADGGVLPYVADWDTMTQPPAEDVAMSRALDVGIAIRSSASVIFALFEQGSINEKSARYAMGMTVIGILEGYLSRIGKRPQDVLNPRTVAPFIDSRMRNIEVMEYIAGLIAA